MITAAKLCQPHFLAVSIVNLFQVRQRFARGARVAVCRNVINLASILAVPGGWVAMPCHAIMAMQMLRNVVFSVWDGGLP